MQKSTLQVRVTNRYNQNDVTLTNLMQEWINENYFFWNLNNNNTSEIKYNCINK